MISLMACCALMTPKFYLCCNLAKEDVNPNNNRAQLKGTKMESYTYIMNKTISLSNKLRISFSNFVIISHYDFQIVNCNSKQ